TRTNGHETREKGYSETEDPDKTKTTTTTTRDGSSDESVGNNGAEEGPIMQTKRKRKNAGLKNWKKMYIRRHKIEKNWRAGNYKQKAFPGSRADTRVRCLQFD